MIVNRLKSLSDVSVGSDSKISLFVDEFDNIGAYSSFGRFVCEIAKFVGHHLWSAWRVDSHDGGFRFTLFVGHHDGDVNFKLGNNMIRDAVGKACDYLNCVDMCSVELGEEHFEEMKDSLFAYMVVSKDGDLPSVKEMLEFWMIEKNIKWMKSFFKTGFMRA